MITKVKTRKKKKVSLSSVNDDDASQQDKTYSINKMKKNESFLSDEQLSSNKIFNIRHVKMKSMNVSKTKNIRKNLKVEESNTSHRKYLINERLEKGNTTDDPSNKKTSADYILLDVRNGMYFF